MKNFICILFISNFWFSFLSASDVQGVLGQRRGIQLLKYQKRPNVWFHFENSAVDQSIETTPPGTKFFDRRVSNYIALGQDVVLSQGGVRVAAELFHQVIKKEEETPPKSPYNKTSATADLGVDYTFVNPKGLEIVFGLQGRYFSATTESQMASNSSSQTKIDSLGVYTPRLALVKRSSQWSGGFYYRQGSGNKARSFRKEGSDGSLLEGSAPVYIPSHYGVSAQFSVGPASVDIDLLAVQAGEGGPESEGVPVHEDYLDIYLRTEAPGLGMALRHRTLSYSRNAFVNLDRIPYTVLAVYTLLGQPDQGLRLGLVGRYGDDGQSIAEFNARYSAQGVGLLAEGFWKL